MAGVLCVSGLAVVYRAGTAGSAADIRLIADEDVAVVLCVVDAAGEARCHTRDGLVSGKIGKGWLNVCGLAERPMVASCEQGQDCTIRGAANASEAFGLLVLEPRQSRNGQPRHRVLDIAVLSPSRADDGAAAKVAAGVSTVARCFAPLPANAESVDVEHPLVQRGCDSAPCRLRHSVVHVALSGDPPAKLR